MTTPFKLLDNHMQSSKFGPKEPSSHELKCQFLENKLVMKEKKLEACQQKIKDFNQKVEGLQKTISVKDQELQNKNLAINSQAQKIASLEQELAKTLASLHEKNRCLTKRQIQNIKQKQEQSTHEKLNKVLTKENSDLIAERHQHKQMMAELNERLCMKEEQIAAEIEQSNLLTKLNEQLKLQIEELLFEIRMLNRRQQTDKLSNYEHNLTERAHKQRQPNEQASEQQKEFIELLKLKIGSLENQLAVSQRRCKQLQTIVLAQ